VVAFDKFINSAQIPFSRLYIKLINTEKNMSISPINIQKIGIKPERSLRSSSNNIYKIRKVFINNITSSLLTDDYNKLTKIINNAWEAKIKESSFDYALSNSVQTLINSVRPCVTIENKSVFRIDYTISVKSRDPEYLGISEPTSDSFQKEFSKHTIQVSNCFGASISRVFIYSMKIDNKNEYTIINNLVSKLWNSQNPLNQISTRISYNLSVNGGYYCSTGKNNLTRISIAWVIDKDEPNEIYFNIPNADDLTNLFSSLNIKIYNEIPFKNHSFYLKNFDDKNFKFVPAIIAQAWSKQNQNFDKINFRVSFLEKSASTFSNR